MKSSSKTLYLTHLSQHHQDYALQAAPAELTVDTLSQPDWPELEAALAETDYLICDRFGSVDARLIEAAPKLKLIIRLGVWVDDVDLEAARRQKIAVCYWPQANTIRMAEHVVMQLLALGKRLNRAQNILLEASPFRRPSKRTTESVFAYNWANIRPINQLWARKVGILGFGEAGVELARRLQNWGCELRYYKRRRLSPEQERRLNLRYTQVDEIAQECDYVVNLLPYNAATVQMLNDVWLTSMKQGAYLVSCGSGGVIDETALARLIQNEHLAGAALDTFEFEPVSEDNPLLRLARQGYNVLLTPHIAAGDNVSNRRDAQNLYTNILRHQRGEFLLYRVV